MGLNTLAGRSFNDLCQYPVFPWVSRNSYLYTSVVFIPLSHVKLSCLVSLGLVGFNGRVIAGTAVALLFFHQSCC